MGMRTYVLLAMLAIAALAGCAQTPPDDEPPGPSLTASGQPPLGGVTTAARPANQTLEIDGDEWSIALNGTLVTGQAFLVLLPFDAARGNYSMSHSVSLESCGAAAGPVAAVLMPPRIVSDVDGRWEVDSFFGDFQAAGYLPWTSGGGADLPRQRHGHDGRDQ